MRDGLLVIDVINDFSHPDGDILLRASGSGTTRCARCCEMRGVAASRSSTPTITGASGTATRRG